VSYTYKKCEQEQRGGFIWLGGTLHSLGADTTFGEPLPEMQRRMPESFKKN
jgi:hypothetical protein